MWQTFGIDYNETHHQIFCPHSLLFSEALKQISPPSHFPQHFHLERTAETKHPVQVYTVTISVGPFSVTIKLHVVYGTCFYWLPPPLPTFWIIKPWNSCMIPIYNCFAWNFVKDNYYTHNKSQTLINSLIPDNINTV